MSYPKISFLGSELYLKCKNKSRGSESGLDPDSMGSLDPYPDPGRQK
jgi:hypothetical protein